MTASVIYKPNGPALEYSPLALNLYESCPHSCCYCYVPGAMHKKPENFFKPAVARKDILKRIAIDGVKLAGDPASVLLCFSCDPYPSLFETPHDDITREALLILEKNDVVANILTKGGTRACKDFDLLMENGWKFGTTLNMNADAAMAEWEPGAAKYADRVEAIRAAHGEGIYTWVSMEPVIFPKQALDILRDLADIVDFWKIGKWNHAKEAARIDWKAFLVNVLDILGDRPHMIKHDLLKAAGRL